jgi:hypothetical protein
LPLNRRLKVSLLGRLTSHMIITTHPSLRLTSGNPLR